MITVGMVVEGSHDNILLEPLIRGEIKAKFDLDVEFRYLQPTPDETGAFGDGGWARVLAWCKANSGEGLETYFKPLFDGEKACDIIVVHLDGDALEHLKAHANISLPDKPPSVKVRVNLVTAAINEWLETPAPRSKQVSLAIPVMHTEAWNLAAVGGQTNVEAIDAKAAFRKGFDRRGPRKLKEFYLERAQGSGSKCDEIAKKCFSYLAFRQSIRAMAVATQSA